MSDNTTKSANTLAQSAHVYSYASKKAQGQDDRGARRSKNRARIKLQRDALAYAADFMEEITSMFLDGGERKKLCVPGVEQLRELVKDADYVLELLDKETEAGR